MKIRRVFFMWVFLLSLATGLGGCGIDRGGIVDTVDINTPFLGAAVIGPIETINGSLITVNESSIETTSAAITTGPFNTMISAYRTGQVVVATALPGTNQRDWDNVSLNFEVAGGPVQIDSAATSFELFGQVVDLSNLNPANIEGGTLPVAAPANIAVSGLVRSNGEIDARAISNYSMLQPALVTGFAHQVDPVNFTFLIGDQLFDFSQAQSINTQTGSIEPNARVRVEINPASATADSLTVISIDEAPLIDPALQPGATISMTAYVTSTVSTDNFELAFQPVSTDMNTFFENPPPNSIAVDQLLLIHGVLQPDRSVLADFVRWIAVN